MAWIAAAVIAGLSGYFVGSDWRAWSSLLATGLLMGAVTAVILWPNFERTNQAVAGSIVGGLLLPALAEVAACVGDFWALRMLTGWPGSCLGTAVGTAIGRRGRPEVKSSLLSGSYCALLVAASYPWIVYSFSQGGGLFVALTVWRTPLEAYLGGILLCIALVGSVAILTDFSLDVGRREVARIRGGPSDPDRVAARANPSASVEPPFSSRFGEAVLSCILGAAHGFGAVLLVYALDLVLSLATLVLMMAKGTTMGTAMPVAWIPNFLAPATGLGLILGLIFGILLILRPYTSTGFGSLIETAGGAVFAWVLIGFPASVFVFLYIMFITENFMVAVEFGGDCLTLLGLINAGYAFLSGLRELAGEEYGSNEYNFYRRFYFCVTFLLSRAE